MKNSLLFYILLFLLNGCKESGQPSSPKNTPDSSDPGKVVAAPVTNPGMEDDAVFSDGSRPASWETAGINNVSGLKIFIKDLQTIVANGHRQELARYIRYPLNSTVKSKSDFLENYDKVITPKVKRALASVNLRQLFRNYKGVMIGSGEIWIAQEGQDFNIIAINQ